MPPIGMALGRVDFSNLFVALNGVTYASLAEAKKAGAPTLNYGVFLNSCLEFLIVAFAVFLLVKQVNRLKGPAIIDTRDCPFCLSKMAIKATRARRARRRSSRRELARGRGAGPRQRRPGLHEQRQIRIAVLPSFDERAIHPPAVLDAAGTVVRPRRSTTAACQISCVSLPTRVALTNSS